MCCTPMVNLVLFDCWLGGAALPTPLGADIYRIYREWDFSHFKIPTTLVQEECNRRTDELMATLY